jgi:hypothetical protein
VKLLCCKAASLAFVAPFSQTYDELLKLLQVRVPSLFILGAQDRRVPAIPNGIQVDLKNFSQ